MDQGKISKEQYAEWLADLQLFLYDFLKDKLDLVTVHNGDEKLIGNTLRPLLDAKMMPIWSTAFTHESLDLVNNYETLEFIGDKALHLCFAEYISQRFTGMTKSQLTEMDTHYLSKTYQAEFAKRFGFEKNIRSSVKLKMSVFEDVMESFFGALNTIGNKIKMGFGHNCVYTIIKNIYDTMDLDIKLSEGHDTMIVPQIFQQLGKNRYDLSELVEETEEGVKFTLKINQEAIDLFFRELGASFRNPLAVATAPTKVEAKNLAYKQAAKKLREKGVTKEWASGYKIRQELERPEFKDYIEKARRSASSMGYDTIRFNILQQARNAKEVTIQLIGERINRDGSKAVAFLVDSVTVPREKEIETKRVMLQQLADKTKVRRNFVVSKQIRQ